MKKQLLTLLSIICFVESYAQTFKEDPNFVKQAPNAKGYMLDTISTSGLTKEQLFSNALSFLTNNFKDSRSVIESKDLDLGEISFQGNISKNISVSDTTKKGKITSHLEKITLFFKCKVYIKDRKFKIVLNSLEKPFMALLPSSPRIPIDIASTLQPAENKAAAELALQLIKDLSTSLNSKPENDF